MFGAYYAGVDVGSVTTAAVIVNAEGSPVGTSVVETGARCARASESALTAAREAAGLNGLPLRSIVATGYGRDRVACRTESVTEITCHARGIAEIVPSCRFLIDVGGQDCKALALGPLGQVETFAMNDRCAAGTGRFFENMCRALEIDLEELGPLALESEPRLTVSHVCAVFAESEVIGLLAQGESKADIAAAVCHSAARQVASLARKVGVREPVAMSGGVARNVGFVKALEAQLGVRVAVPDQPEIIGALGAANMALGARSDE